MVNLEIYVPCGTCEICTRRRTREWADRLVLHYDTMTVKKACFVTLTYNKEHIPDNYSLNKRDIQLFFKRIRKWFEQRQIDQKIKYYLCGEYGPKTSRPHYHAIIFGMDASLETKEIIDYCWPNGYNSIKRFNRERAHYVAGYIQKKVYGKKASKIHYENQNRIPPFSMMSKGITLEYIKKNAADLKKRLIYMIKGVPRIIPRYFRKILEVTKDEIYEMVRPYIHQDIENARLIGIEPLSYVELNWKGADYEYTEEERAKMTKDYEDAIKDGRVHGEHIVTSQFLDWLHQCRMQKKYELRKEGERWRTNVESWIMLQEAKPEMNFA